MASRHVLLGVSGGIAAYKAAELTRRLRARGAEVRVVMTRAAQAFVGPLTLQALSGNPVRLDLLDPAAEAGMDHIELARWADLVLVAPASADVLARLVPVDLRLAACPAGSALRTGLNHMNAVILRTGDHSFEVMVFRSMARTAWHELETTMHMVAARSGMKI